MSTLSDNGSGNRSGWLLEKRYTIRFGQLRGPHANIAPALGNPESASVLWSLQADSITEKHSSTKRRLLVTDNVLMRHNLAQQIDTLSKGNVKCLCAIKLPTVDKLIHFDIKALQTRLNDVASVGWLFMQVLSMEWRGRPNALCVKAKNCGYPFFLERLRYRNILYNALKITPDDTLEQSMSKSKGLQNSLRAWDDDSPALDRKRVSASYKNRGADNCSELQHIF